MRLLRAEQIARLKQMQAERLRAIALADVEREKAEREKAEAEAARQRAEQQAELDQQKEAMQKEIMRLLHQQVRKYWLLARMCNDVIVHASLGGFFVYLSAGWKAKLGHSPAAVSEDASFVHPDDLLAMKRLCTSSPALPPAQKGSPRAPPSRGALLSQPSPPGGKKSPAGSGSASFREVDSSTTSDSDGDTAATDVLREDTAVALHREGLTTRAVQDAFADETVRRWPSRSRGDKMVEGRRLHALQVAIQQRASHGVCSDHLARDQAACGALLALADDQRLAHSVHQALQQIGVQRRILDAPRSLAV